MAIQKLKYSDSDDFYDRLKAALKTGDEVEVETDYVRYAELPEKLKVIFELEKHRTGNWIDFTTGDFVVGAAASAGINTKSLLVLGATAAGATVGVFFGPVGAAAGAGIGLVTGTVAAVLMDSAHGVDIKIDQRGRLTIKIRPNKKV